MLAGAALYVAQLETVLESKGRQMTKKDNPSQDMSEVTTVVMSELRDQITAELSRAKNSEKIEMLVYDFSQAIASLFQEKGGEVLAAVTGRLIMGISAYRECSPLEAAQVALADWAMFCIDDDPDLKEKVMGKLETSLSQNNGNSDPKTPLN
jgi:hypothetical protein